MGGVGFSFSVFSADALAGVRFTLGGADNLVACCSSRRRFASGVVEAGVLPVPRLCVDFVRSWKCLTWGCVSCAAPVAVRTARANPRIGKWLISQSPALELLAVGACTLPYRFLGYLMLPHSPGERLANNLKPLNEMPWAIIARTGSDPDRPSPGRGCCATQCTLRANFPRRLARGPAYADSETRILPRALVLYLYLSYTCTLLSGN